MDLPEIDRRTTVFSLIALSSGTVSAGCFSRFREPESNVTIETELEDGESVSVDGVSFGSDDAPCGIVFVPQINMDRTSWTTQAEALTGDDRFGLAIDPEENRSEAIRGALEYLRTTVGVEHAVLIGASIGGEAAVVAAAAAGDVDGLVALSPGGGTDHASAVRARSLFVVAEDDDERFVETTRTLHENAPEPTRVEVLPGDDHGQRLFETDRGDELEQWIDDLIETACDEG